MAHYRIGIRIAALMLLVAAGLVLLFMTVEESSAETIIASQDGSGEYEKIQDAIDNATVGDTIRVWEGTYYEKVVVDKTLSLVGNGSEVTTIDGGGEGEVVLIAAEWVNMSGFMVTNGNSGISLGHPGYSSITNNNCSNNVIGIHLYESHNNTITDNICSNNVNGIYFHQNSDHNTLTGNICSNNTGSSESHGIRLTWNSNYNTISDNTCLDNRHNGIHLYKSHHNVLSNNICSNRHFGIYLYSSSYCTIPNNRCSNGSSGISLSGSYNTIFSNICSNNGWSGIHLSDSNNTITNNTCSNNERSGISLFSSNHNTIANNTITSNDESGISLSWYSDYTTITNNTIIENGIGIYLDDSSENNTAHYNNIFNNKEFGINATENNGYIIDAIYNWWGHPYGPYHPINNPDGKGDNVTDGVPFDPWLSEEQPGNVKPTITITEPANNSKVSGTVTISGNANDRDGTVQKVEISINGGGWTEVTGTDSWNHEWNSTTVANGDYEIRVRAYDGEEYSQITVWNLKVENLEETPDDNENDDDDGGGSGGFIPGFGAVAVVGAVGIVLILTFNKRKKED